MSNVTVFPKVHASFFTNASVQGMLKMGFSVAETLEVHGQLFEAIAGMCAVPDQLVGDQVSEADARGAFMRAFGRKMESMSDAEYDAKARRAAYFATIPAKKLRAMTAKQWQDAAARAEASAA